MQRHGYVEWTPLYLNFTTERRHGAIWIIGDGMEEEDPLCAICGWERKHWYHRGPGGAITSDGVLSPLPRKDMKPSGAGRYERPEMVQSG